jgi:hypothetical protein
VALLKPEGVWGPHEAMARAVVPADLKRSSDVPQVGPDDCAKVPQKFQGRLDQVVLRPDRSMLVRFNNRRRGTDSQEFIFTSGRIRACKRRVSSDGACSNVAVVEVRRIRTMIQRSSSVAGSGRPRAAMAMAA